MNINIIKYSIRIMHKWSSRKVRKGEKYYEKTY